MRARLAAATRSVCVALESGDLVGSGVFVGPGEVLTCAHVVSDPDDPVTGRWNERELSLRVAEWLPDLDLALLRCDGEVADLWAGLSAEAEPGDELWAFGFPGGPYRSGDSVSFRYDGPSRLRGRDDLLRVTHGRAMEGFSGAPVLNWRTGGVCGLLRRSDQPAGGPPGARLVPVPVIRSALPSLSTAPGWLGLLDDEQIGAGGWQALGPRVRSYLAAARTEAGRHPYGLGVAFAPRLDTVYVSQQADALAATGPARHLDAASLVDEYGGGLVVGGPGAGKSSLLRHLLALAADDRRVPVLVPAAALAGDLPLPRALAEGVYATLGSSVDDLDLAELLARHAAPGVPWLVLVDGVDELQGQEARARVLRAVARWWRDDRYRFVVTSRPLPQAELSVLYGERFPVVEIQPLADAQLPVLATRWFTALGLDDVPAMVERFMTRLSLGPLARVPLIATMICLVFAESPGNPLPPTRAELYERFVGILLGKAGREGDRRLLTDVALKVITEDADPGDLAPAEMLRRSGLMVERSGGFAFAHRTIAEYLAACRLAERRPGRLARWRIMLGAGRQNSLDLFMAALLKDRGVDLTEPVPHRFLLPRLAHARLVAALAREGVAVRGGTLEAAERTLREVVEGRLQAVPEALREFGWEWADDSVLAATSLALLNRSAGLEALARLAADPEVGGFTIHDAGGHMAELLDVAPEEGRALLGRQAADPANRSHDRLGIARFLGQPELLRALSADPSMDDDDRLACARDLDEADLYAALLEDGTVGVTWRRAAFERLKELRPGTPDPFPPAPDQAWERMAHVARAKDPEQAWAALRDPRVPALPRVFACLLLQDWCPEDGRAALDELANDPTLGGFHRVFWGQDQARLAADPGLGRQWRVFAAEQLGDPALLSRLAADPTLDSRHRRRCDMMARWIRSR